MQLTYCILRYSLRNISSRNNVFLCTEGGTFFVNKHEMFLSETAKEKTNCQMCLRN